MSSENLVCGYWRTDAHAAVLNLIAEAIVAWNQVGLLLGGGLFAGIGLLLLGNRIYWRIRARRATATIIGE
jgi:hypothetical protein